MKVLFFCFYLLLSIAFILAYAFDFLPLVPAGSFALVSFVAGLICLFDKKKIEK